MYFKFSFPFLIFNSVIMSNNKELSILSNWLEEKLKVYFVKKSQLRSPTWKIFSPDCNSPNFASLFVPNQSNGVVPIQTAVSDFRILDFKLENEKKKSSNKKHSNSNLSPFYIAADDDDTDPLNPDHSNPISNANASASAVDEDEMFNESSPSSSNSARKKATASDEPYQTRNSHVYLVYQETCQSVGKELRLFLQASQIDNMKAMEDIIPKYEMALDEHQIDVYTRVFPLLKHWSLHQKVSINLPVPECYYGSYETEMSSGGILDDARSTLGSDDVSGNINENDDINDNLDAHLFQDDIMSKVAAGLEFYERDRRKRESKTGRQSSYRLLILEDVEKQGFKLRNVGESSTFLALLNVEEALKNLAEIHSVSWAYSQVSRKSLVKTWPFLNNPLYLPYLKERVKSGFPSMERLVQAHLICSGKETEEDGRKILTSLMKLGSHLKEILEGARHPRRVKCLIHQSTCFSSFLFRYTMLTRSNKENKEVKDEVVGMAKEAIKKGKNDNVTDQNDDNGKRGRDNDKFGKKDKVKHKSSATPSSSAACNEDNNDSFSTTEASRQSLEKGLSREVMVINWRTASVGSPMIDVAFLLLTSLPPITRRVETQSLLRIYWNTFRMYAKKFGVGLRWSDKELYEDYLAALMYTCVLITGNITGSQCELDNEAMEVFIEALKDLMNENVI